MTGRWLNVFMIGALILVSACGASASPAPAVPTSGQPASVGPSATATAQGASAKPTPTLRPNEFVEVEQAVRHVVPWLDDLKAIDPSDLRSTTTRSMILAQGSWGLVHGHPLQLDPILREYEDQFTRFAVAYVANRDVATPLAATLATRDPIAALIGSAAGVPLAPTETVVISGAGSMTSEAFTLPDSDFVVSFRGEATDPSGGPLKLHLFANDGGYDISPPIPADLSMSGAGAYRFDAYLRFAKAGSYHIEVVAPAGTWVVSFTP